MIVWVVVQLFNRAASLCSVLLSYWGSIGRAVTISAAFSSPAASRDQEILPLSHVPLNLEWDRLLAGLLSYNDTSLVQCYRLMLS